MKKINTGLGPIAPEDLGVTLVHEHIAISYPGWDCDPLSRPYNREKTAKIALRALEPVKDYGDQRQPFFPTEVLIIADHYGVKSLIDEERRDNGI